MQFFLKLAAFRRKRTLVRAQFGTDVRNDIYCNFCHSQSVNIELCKFASLFTFVNYRKGGKVEEERVLGRSQLEDNQQRALLILFALLSQPPRAFTVDIRTLSPRPAAGFINCQKP